MLQKVQLYNSWHGTIYLGSIFYDDSFSSGFKLKDRKDKYGTKKEENHKWRNLDNEVNSKFFIKISRKWLAYNKLPEFKTFYYQNTNIFYLSGQYFCNILCSSRTFSFLSTASRWINGRWWRGTIGDTAFPYYLQWRRVRCTALESRIRCACVRCMIFTVIRWDCLREYNSR